MSSVGKVVVFQQVFFLIWQKNGSYSLNFQEKYFCQNPFSAILRLFKKTKQKGRMTTKLEGSGVKGLRSLLRLP